MDVLRERLKGKKVLMVLASYGFRDEEYLKPRQILEDSGAKVLVGASGAEPAQGMLGTEVKPDLTLDQIKLADFAGVIFVGGSGATEYFDSPAAHNLARDTFAEHKPLGAICIAPAIIGNAGLLKGKIFTAFSTVVKKIEKQGGIFHNAPVVQDGLILTAEGPKAAQQFGQAFVQMLQ